MKDQRHDDAFREIAWKRSLTDAEAAELRSWLAAHPDPDAEADWNAELALSEALRRLPDAPCPSNFTARVVDAAMREPSPGRLQGFLRGLWRSPRLGWVPRLGFAAAVALAGFVSVQQIQHARQERLIWSVGLMSEVAAMPGADALRDFEVIRTLEVSPRADEELLRLLQ